MSQTISTVFAVLALPLILAVCVLGQQGRSKEVNAEGFVVAVQLDPAQRDRRWM